MSLEHAVQSMDPAAVAQDTWDSTVTQLVPTTPTETTVANRVSVRTEPHAMLTTAPATAVLDILDTSVKRNVRMVISDICAAANVTVKIKQSVT